MHADAFDEQYTVTETADTYELGVRKRPAGTATYVSAYIRCRVCGLASYSAQDVRHRYCAQCDLFHDSLTAAPQ